MSRSAGGERTLARPSRHATALASVLALGVGLRVAGFPTFPRGLNQDELTSAYESFSILRTGRDRLGGRFAPYLPGDGAGQNALQSYLDLPVVRMAGLTPLGVRLVALICGLATLPLLYVVVRRWHGRQVALVATAALAVTPWSVWNAHWGLDCNLLPFVTLVGVATFGAAIDHGERRRWVVHVSLVPFAVALYAYAACAFVLPLLVLALLVAHRRALRRRRVDWVVAGAVAALLSAPFYLFLLDARLLGGRRLPGEGLLPFTIPRVSVLRDQQVGIDVPASLRLIEHGFGDGYPWTNAGHLPAVSLVLLLLTPMGVAAQWWRRPRPPADASSGPAAGSSEVSPFVWWLLAGCTLVVTVTLDTNRANALLIPVVVLGSAGILRLGEVVARLRSARAGRWAVGACLSWVLLAGLVAYAAYWLPAHRRVLDQAFTPGAGPAIRVAAATDGDRPVLVRGLLIPQTQVLFWLRLSPDVLPPGTGPSDPSFGRWYFDPGVLPPGPHLVVSRTTTSTAGFAGVRTLWMGQGWAVRSCDG